MKAPDIELFIGEHDCPFVSMLFGLLPEFPFAPEMTRDLRKSHSSLLNHIFSTIPAIALSSTQNWVCSHSGSLGGDAEKIYIRARSSFPEFPGI